ncbi:MAG: transposase [Verrucomicrobiota bacterium]|nr:transposase [Verrucomicrobiota bacterium]
MLSFTGALKVYAALEPQDMRKSFNGLSAVVEQHLQNDPYQDALYLFANRRRNRIKIRLGTARGCGWRPNGLSRAASVGRSGTDLFSWTKPRLNISGPATGGSATDTSGR